MENLIQYSKAMTSALCLGENTLVELELVICSESESEVSGSLNVTQSRPTLCNPMDCSLRGSSVNGIFPRWSELPFPCSGDLPDPGVKPRSPTL